MHFELESPPNDYRVLGNRNSKVWHLGSATGGLRACCGFQGDPARTVIAEEGAVTCRQCLRSTAFRMALATRSVREEL